jgi:hypothetical protein
MWMVYLALDMLVAPYSIAKAQLGMRVLCRQTAMAFVQQKWGVQRNGALHPAPWSWADVVLMWAVYLA